MAGMNRDNSADMYSRGNGTNRPTDHSRAFSRLSRDAKTVLNLVQKQGPLAKSRLAELTGMKQTTLNRAVEMLKSYGILVESGTGKSTGGRRPCLYTVNPLRFAVIGIDISRTCTRVVITDLCMNIRYEKNFAMDPSHTPQKTVNTVADILLEGVGALGLEKPYILGAGVGTVGPLDRQEGRLASPINFPASGWENVPIKNMLEARLDLPVSIDNGANMSVLAEYLFGRGKGYRSVSYFNCGVGIRTGAISSGMIVRSINDAEDAFGHMIVDVDGEICSCGNYGCIECYSSIPSITRKFISAVKKGGATRIHKEPDEITYRDICTAASEGDHLAGEILSGAAAILGAGLANYINLLSPELIILSGPLISHSDLFFNMAVETASRKYYSRDIRKVVFSKGGCFGDNAISLGAAAMVVEKQLGTGVGI